MSIQAITKKADDLGLIYYTTCHTDIDGHGWRYIHILCCPTMKRLDIVTTETDPDIYNWSVADGLEVAKSGSNIIVSGNDVVETILEVIDSLLDEDK